MELFQRVAEARGRLLRVQCYRERGSRTYRRLSGLLLTFDVGRILVWADNTADGDEELSSMHVKDTEDIAGGLRVLDEEEPWWRVLGSPLCRVWSRRDPARIRLQFRTDDSNPRFIELAKKGRLVEIEMDAVPQTE